MLNGYVKHSSNSSGLPLGWDAGLKVEKFYGEYDQLTVLFLDFPGKEFTPCPVVGWSDLNGGTEVPLRVYKIEGQPGVLLTGGNNGIRIFHPDPRRHDQHLHLPDGFGMPIAWVDYNDVVQWGTNDLGKP